MFDYSTEGLTLIDPRTVRIVARTAAAKQLYRERVLHYDEAGLLRQTEIAEPDGSRTVMNRTWQETDRGALLLSISGQARGIPNEMQVAWQEVDGFFVPRQITFVVDGIRVEQHVSDVRINARSR
jgi:hypothetical protein